MGFDIGNDAGSVHFTVWTWPLVLELAERHGWQPTGTEPPPPGYARVPSDDHEAVAEALELAERVYAEAWSPREPGPPVEREREARGGSRCRWILCEAFPADLWGGTYLTIQRQTIGADDGARLASALRQALEDWEASAAFAAASSAALDERLRLGDANDGLEGDGEAASLQAEPLGPSVSDRDLKAMHRSMLRLIPILEAGPVTIS